MQLIKLNLLFFVFSTIFAVELKINPQKTNYISGRYLGYEKSDKEVWIHLADQAPWALCHSAPKNQEKARAILDTWSYGDEIRYTEQSVGKVSPLVNRRTQEVLFAYKEFHPIGRRTSVRICSERCSGSHFLVDSILGEHFSRNHLYIRSSTDDLRPQHSRHFHEWNLLPKDIWNFSSTEEVISGFDPNRFEVLRKYPGSMVTIVRHPYDWLRSFYKKQWYGAKQQQDVDFSTWIRSPWLSVTKELDPFTQQPFKNPLQLRSMQLIVMLQKAARYKRHLICTYEEVVKAPELLIAYFANLLEISPLPYFKPAHTYKNRHGQTYTPRHYPPLKQEDLNYINSHLSAKLEALLGYPLAKKAKHVPANYL